MTTVGGESVSVGVVGICGARALSGCLAALSRQVQAPPFEVVVVYDPVLSGVRELAGLHDDVRWIESDQGCEPAVMAARCLSEAQGSIILLTEDHCRPAPDWVRRLCDAHHADAAVVGGSIEIDSTARPVDWAFCYVDFYRYAEPLSAGPASHASVCNVAYKRSCLEAVRPCWRETLHETALHGALAERFGPLVMEPEARVTLLRQVRFGDAMRERYVFGRWFAARRVEHASPTARVKWIVLSCLLPAVLMARMTRTAMKRPRLRRPFARSLMAVTALVLAWSWGEWVGYLTARPPRDLTAARQTR